MTGSFGFANLGPSPLSRMRRLGLRRIALLGGVALAAASLVPAAAHADPYWRHGRGEGWHEGGHEGWRGGGWGYRGPVVVFGPRYVAPPVYYAPPPVYYAPPPPRAYYAPPAPAYYAPPPVYAAPSISLGVNIPLR